MDGSVIFLNASEHLFELGFSETLMLRNYSRVNNFNFCSMIGGSESIRDLQEAKNLSADAYEFPLVESEFSVGKIFSAFDKVFSDDFSIINQHKIFINIASGDGLEMLEVIDNVKLPSYINKKNIVFNFDRRSLVKSRKAIIGEDFEVKEYEEELNKELFINIKSLKGKGFMTSISGGITNQSLNKIMSFSELPDFIKTGLFTLSLSKLKVEELHKKILHFHGLEAELTTLMSESLYTRYDYLSKRQIHLTNYIIEAIR